MPRIILRLLLLLFVSWTAVLAQDSIYTLKVDVPFVSVDVSVTDQNGKLVTDLSINDFDLYENGIEQEIRQFAPVSAPYNVFLLFDRSGSTQHKWPLMQRAVAGFIESLRPQDRIAIGSFDADFQVQLEWTADRRKALLALPELIEPKAAGGTELYASIDRTLNREFRKITGRRVLVVLTDGRDTSLYESLVRRNWLPEPIDDHEFQMAFKAVRQSRIPTYFVAFNTDKNLEPNTMGSDEYRNLQIIFPRSSVPQRYLRQVRLRMEEIAETSGGRILFPETIEQIIPLYQQIGRELGTSYTLGYISSNASAPGEFRRIEVRSRDNTLRLTQSRDGYSAR